MAKHPNHTPQTPMLIPGRVEDFVVKHLDGPMSRLAGHLPSVFATVHHTGRKSGTPYATTVQAFRRGDTVAIALVHGKTNWVENVLAAGGADITVKGRDIHVVNPRILPAGSDGSGLPLPMRATLKVAAVLVADIAA